MSIFVYGGNISFIIIYSYDMYLTIMTPNQNTEQIQRSRQINHLYENRALVLL